MIILSAHLSQLDTVSNAARHRELRNALIMLGYSPSDVRGAYKGVPEDSLLVPVTELDPVLRGLALRFNQESVLLVDRDNNATLIFNNGSTKPIGHWVEVASVEGLDAYTSYNGRHYTAK